MAKLGSEFGIKILLAENDLQRASLLQALLENCGHVVTHCSSGVRVIDVLMESNFDLVIMNVHMPKIDGIGLSRWIRCIAGNISLIVIPEVLVTEMSTFFLQLKTMLPPETHKPALAASLIEKIPTNCNDNSLKK